MPALIYGIVGITIAVIGGVIGLAALHADSTVVLLLPFVGTVITTLITLYKVNETHKEVTDVSGKVTDVDDKVNGRMSELIEKIPAQDKD